MSRSVCLVALLLACAPLAAQPVDVSLATPGVTFRLPLAVEIEPGPGALHPNRVYVLEKQGRLKTLVPGDAAATVFLDLRASVDAAGEGGLLGLAFHPDYAQNGRLFVSYTAPVDVPKPRERVMVSRLSEFTRSASDPLAVDPASERVLLEVDQPFDNHNGGTVDFGPDGYLYWSLGDGGDAGDPLGNGQDPTTLLGALLRIDVDDAPEGEPYGIPDSNPFAQTDGPERDEIFAYGLRNPFKFDAGAAGVWVGDVGQNTWEEVNLVEAGGNYGWNEVEGPDCYPPRTDGCDPTLYEAPLHAYPHTFATGGFSITGGYVLDDADLALSGAYLFGDYVTGRLWALDVGTSEVSVVLESSDFPGAGGIVNIVSIDPAPNGIDVLVTDLEDGRIYRLARAGTPTEAGPDVARVLSLVGPNPFRLGTAVRLDAPPGARARVALLDVLGREVAVLWDGSGGTRALPLAGADLAPGVYTVVASVGERRQVVRVVRTR
jgi:glucose/arabinose dehydrogenase